MRGQNSGCTRMMFLTALAVGQQSVTSFPNVDDANSYWIVRAIPDTSAKQGDPIKSGSLIRLQHMKTRKWLHSHLHASPISDNMEVVSEKASSSKKPSTLQGRQILAKRRCRVVKEKPKENLNEGGKAAPYTISSSVIESGPQVMQAGALQPRKMGPNIRAPPIINFNPQQFIGSPSVGAEQPREVNSNESVQQWWQEVYHTVKLERGSKEEIR